MNGIYSKNGYEIPTFARAIATMPKKVSSGFWTSLTARAPKKAQNKSYPGVIRGNNGETAKAV